MKGERIIVWCGKDLRARFVDVGEPLLPAHGGQPLAESHGDFSILRRDHHRARFVDKAPLAPDLDGGQSLGENARRGVLRRDHLRARLVDEADVLLVLHDARQPLGEDPHIGVRLFRQARAVRAVKAPSLVRALHEGSAVMIGDDVALRDGEDQRAVRPVATPFLVHILYDDAILRQLLDVTVGGGDDLLAVRTEHTPFLPLTHEEIALGVGAYLVVLRCDHGGARRRDGAPFPCGLDEGERCRMNGGGRLLPAVDQDAHPRVERVVVDGFGGGVRNLCRDQACGGKRGDGGAQT